MKKKLFKNYSFDFDKSEKKVISSFCKQAIKQMDGDERFYKDIKSFNSIIDKLEGTEESVKLTKEEKTKLVFQFKENVKYLKKKMDESWIVKKWFYKSMYNQYNNLILKYFSD